MKRRPGIFSAAQKASGVLMVLTLLWLTISTPYVYTGQQEIKAATQKQDGQSSDNNPFSNTTEEKSESGVNTLSEYLHAVHELENIPVTITSFYKCHPSDLYFAFHPDLLIPPPKA